MIRAIVVAMVLAAIGPAAQAANPAKCPACSFTAVQQPYDAVRQALAEGDLAHTKAAAAALRQAAQAEAEWAKSATGRGPDLVRPWSEMAAAAIKIERSASITDARKAFGTAATDRLLQAMKIAERDDLKTYYCPMVKLRWVQPKGPVDNPFGSKMRACGTLVKP